MKIKNVLAFLPDKSFAPREIQFDSHIRAVAETLPDEEALDGQGLYLLPGLVDVHSHGAVGGDHSDGLPEKLAEMSVFYAANGVTSVCPTTMTLNEAALTRALHAIRDFAPPENGARTVGVNLEGPFLSRAKCGAQNANFLALPDAALFHRLNEAAGGLARLVTVAPELPGALAFIREVSQSCAVSLGHTAADYDTAMAAFAAGASHVTHLFNAMPPLHHREPGLIAAALDAGAAAEVICDGQHIHPAVLRAAAKLFGDKLLVVSDSQRCAGMPEGEYELGGQVTILKDGLARLRDGTIAGSATNMLEEARNLRRYGLPLADILWACTAAPADSIGCRDIGRLAPGCRADLLLADEALGLRQVFIGGRPIL